MARIGNPETVCSITALVHRDRLCICSWSVPEGSPRALLPATTETQLAIAFVGTDRPDVTSATAILRSGQLTPRGYRHIAAARSGALCGAMGALLRPSPAPTLAQSGRTAAGLLSLQPAAVLNRMQLSAVIRGVGSTSGQQKTLRLEGFCEYRYRDSKPTEED